MDGLVFLIQNQFNEPNFYWFISINDLSLELNCNSVWSPPPPPPRSTIQSGLGFIKL